MVLLDVFRVGIHQPVFADTVCSGSRGEFRSGVRSNVFKAIRISIVSGSGQLQFGADGIWEGEENVPGNRSVHASFHFGVTGDSRNGASKTGVTKLELGNEMPNVKAGSRLLIESSCLSVTIPFCESFSLPRTAR